MTVFLRTPDFVYAVLGTVLLALGTGARFVALAQLGMGYSGAIIIRENQALVRTSIYRLVRHPLHLALLVELLGMIVYTERWWLSPLWVLLAVVIHFRNMHERRWRQDRAVLRYTSSVCRILGLMRPKLPVK